VLAYNVWDWASIIGQSVVEGVLRDVDVDEDGVMLSEPIFEISELTQSM